MSCMSELKIRNVWFKYEKIVVINIQNTQNESKFWNYSYCYAQKFIRGNVYKTYQTE